MDESPYGVRGLGGNVREWCADPAGTDGERRAERGGFWTGYAGTNQAPKRYSSQPHVRLPMLGFRLARGLG